jgi:hypothetical protein
MRRYSIFDLMLNDGIYIYLYHESEKSLQRISINIYIESRNCSVNTEFYV